ncbi:MAG: hypothetical protein ACYDC6_02795, partial [Acidobacteriaceae bacterium]
RISAKCFMGLSISPSHRLKPLLHMAIKMRLPWWSPGRCTDRLQGSDRFEILQDDVWTIEELILLLGKRSAR